MKAVRNVSVMGLGAIGAVYAAKLYDMDPGCVTVIADEDRIARYSAEGVSINGKAYGFRYVKPGEQVVAPDLIMVAVKYHHLAQTVEALKKCIGPDTVVMSLLNGIDSEEILGGELGKERMLYAVCIGIDAVRSGSNIRYTTFGKLHFGESKNTVISERVAQVKALFDKAKLPYIIPEDMIRAIWWKYMVNVAVNQASAVLKAPYGVFQTVPEARELMEAVMKEVIAVSEKVGVGLREQDIPEVHKVLGTLSAGGKTSMLQDMEAGRKTEVEMLSGVLCALGKKYGVSTPVNETLFRMIKTLEQMPCLEK